jgi:DNA-binding protein YbaB
MADLQADYDALQSMAEIFERAAQQFDQMQSSIQQMAQQLEGGALKGVAGDRLVRLLENNLARKVAFGAEKFRELKKDVLDAMGDLSDADQQGASQF